MSGNITTKGNESTMESNCTNGQDHVQEYHSTNDGKSYWICWLCGKVVFEMEDTIQ